VRHKNPNLARRPFVNQRPVLRISILLWVLGAALFAYNVVQYWSFSRGQDVKRGQLEEIRASIEAEEASIQQLNNRVAEIDLESQNEQVAFLNQKIRERTFGWSLLFDTLAGILPDEVRIERLSLEGEPSSSSGPRTAGRRRGVPSEAMHFGIQGEARDFEALLSFIDALNASPAFAEPNLGRDAKKGGLFQFRLGVDYYPSRAAGLQGGEPGEEAESAATAEAAAASRPDAVATGTGGATEGRGDDSDEDGEDGRAGQGGAGAGEGFAAARPAPAAALSTPPRRNPLAEPPANPLAARPRTHPDPAPAAGAPTAGTPATAQVVGGPVAAPGTAAPEAAPPRTPPTTPPTTPPAPTRTPSETGSAPPATRQPSEPETPDTLTTRPSASGAPVLAPGGPSGNTPRRIR
jgi:Tfp pilus assembly protein PilN